MLAALVVAGLSASTQYVAGELHQDPQLGPAWTVVGGHAVYAPWAWIAWSGRYGPQFPTLFRNASAISTLAALLGVAGVAAASARRRRTAASVAHGSSRWATTRELRKAGLLRDAGVVLCQTDDAAFDTAVGPDGAPKTTVRRLGRLVRHDGPEHVLCFAPTRSGKGVGLVIPTLLSWPHSVLVYDIKKENWALTAGWRRQFSRVWRFEPTAMDSVRFNPLLEIRKGLTEVKDTQNVADILVDPTGDKDVRDHWQTTAHALLCGAILHVLYAEADKTLAGVAAVLADPACTQRQTLARMLMTPHLPSGPHPAIAQAAREMLNKSDNELSGVVSTAMACLGLYRDPVIARNTAASDFRIADLMNGDAPASLYLVVPPSDLARTRPIVRLMLNQIGRRLTESMQVGGKTAYKHRLLLLLDEFPSLGRLEFFETALAFIAGYGLKAFLIAQSLNQLEKAYGPNNSILDNCHVRLTYAANDDKTAKRISDLLGHATEKRLQKSYSGSGLFLTHRSESEHEYGRPLLTPAEVNQLPQDEGLLLVGGLLPYRARKVRYFLDARFRDRGRLSPPDSADEQGRELPPLTPGDWEGPAATLSPEQPGPPATRDISNDLPLPPARGAPTEPSTDTVDGLWRSFLALRHQKNSNDDSPSTEPTERRDLPL
ncbi:MAG: IncP-type conjugal transfer protein TraG [Polyangiaceae bacterium]